MSCSMKDNVREGFEEWATKQGLVIAKGFSGSYSHVALLAWEAWQASRAALVVKLPEERVARGYGEQVADALGFNDGVEYCRQAIEGAGVKVKE